MKNIVNIAAYQFATLTDLPPLRDALKKLCHQQQLRGTILLSPEGINLFVAGGRGGVDALLDAIRSQPQLADIPVKESFSAEQPFNRMLVKIKKEIIAFGVEGIDPRQHTSPRISPEELRRWLDEGRPVTLLDTRNRFEAAVGTFDGAVVAPVDNFRDFPGVVDQLPAEMKDQPVVTFCTGGIRCEKAAPYLESAGFKNVYQLDGGILKYFEDCGGAHYNGECFVFDKRVALDAALQETGARQCFACQAPLSTADLQHEGYAEGVSCPHCYLSEAQQLSALLDDRNRAIRQITSPLPGRGPYENIRPIRIPQQHQGGELLDVLDAMYTRLNRSQWQQVCDAGQLHCNGQPVHPGYLVQAGDRLLHHIPAECEPDVNAAIEVLHEDEAIVVVNKPAPLPVHPCGRFNRNSLVYILNQVFHPLKLRPAHRLDAGVTGVMVLCKKRQYARLVQPQFEAGQVQKKYLTRVIGTPPGDTFESRTAIASEPATGGIRLPDPDGQPSHTRFRTLEKITGGAIVEAEPVTGRTNQIRIHLWDLGIPISDDPVYLPGGVTTSANPSTVANPPICLHAAAITFQHPVSGKPVTFTAPAPAFCK